MDAIDGSRFDNGALVTLTAGRKVAQRRDGMALHLFVLVKRQKADERLEEASLNDGRLIRGVDRHVAHTRRSRENKWEIRGVQKTKQGLQTVGLDNLNLVLF